MYNCNFSVPWVVVFAFNERKTTSTANDTTGSLPVKCNSGTTETRTTECCFSVRKTLVKSWSHRIVVAEPLQWNSARVGLD